MVKNPRASSKTTWILRSNSRNLIQLIVTVIMCFAFARHFQHKHQSIAALFEAPASVAKVLPRFAKKKNKNHAFAFITFHGENGNPLSLQETFFPSLDTWLPKTKNNNSTPLYVVMNKAGKEIYQQKCDQMNKTDYCEAILPIWVDCLWSPGPSCCAAQEAMVQIMDNHTDFDWFIFINDGKYVRKSYLEGYLSPLDPMEPIVVAPSPLCGLGKSCFDSSSYQCSQSIEFQYPHNLDLVIYNRGAARLLHEGMKMGGLVKQCSEFDVPRSYGLQIMTWMYSINLLRIPIADEALNIGETDKELWLNVPDAVFSAQVTPRKSITQLHERYENASTPDYFYMWHNVTGFRFTETFKKHGDPSKWTDEWHTMPVHDCNVSEDVIEAHFEEPLTPMSEIEKFWKNDSNKPKIAFITHSRFGQEDRMKRMVTASLDTWLTEGVYFVILNTRWRKHFHSFCLDWPDHCKRIQPIWLRCVDYLYGPSLCCKSQEGLVKMMENYDVFDWYVYMDDSMYMRLDFMKEYFSSILSSEPVVALSAPMPPLGLSRFDGNSYKCSETNDFLYPWGQPAIYSHGALKRLYSGLKLGSLEKQCIAFDCSHDVGNQVLHWMYSLPALRLLISDLKLTQHRMGVPFEKNGVMGIYGMGRLGTGAMSMEECHEHVMSEVGNRTLHRFVWHNVTGFERTETFHEFGDPSGWNDVWHTMPTKDCLVLDGGN